MSNATIFSLKWIKYTYWLGAYFSWLSLMTLSVTTSGIDSILIAGFVGATTACNDSRSSYLEYGNNWALSNRSILSVCKRSDTVVRLYNSHLRRHLMRYSNHVSLWLCAEWLCASIIGQSWLTQAKVCRGHICYILQYVKDNHFFNIIGHKIDTQCLLTFI